jgi:hypothetical protein
MWCGAPPADFDRLEIPEACSISTRNLKRSAPAIHHLIRGRAAAGVTNSPRGPFMEEHPERPVPSVIGSSERVSKVQSTLSRKLLNLIANEANLSRGQLSRDPRAYPFASYLVAAYTQRSKAANTLNACRSAWAAFGALCISEAFCTGEAFCGRKVASLPGTPVTSSRRQRL